MKIKKLLSLLLSLIFAVTAISGCGGIELGDILEEVEYLAGLESEYTDDTTTEPLDDVKSEQTDTSQETGTTDQPEDITTQKPDITQETETIDEYGTYTSKEDVALYIHTYRKLPPNFITKNEARNLGWQGGGLEDYAPGKCIGGDYFGNYEGVLPDGEYHECDIDTLGASKRGAKRIIYSDDGRIYYTDDHYETFTLLYGEE